MRLEALRWALALVLVCLGSGLRLQAEQPANTLTDAQKAAGWKLLFDGQTTDGWRNYGADEVGSGWKVEDGALVRAAQRAGDIITKEQFGAFELVLEYKISKGGNSGLMYHVVEKKGSPPWHTGPEVQIQDNKDGHDPQLSGWLYQLYPAETDATKPAGEWNELRILMSPEKCEQYMNGVKYCDYVKGSADWNDRVAKSKFSEFAGFGKATKGHICLQDHGSPVSFRSIRIRVID